MEGRPGGEEGPVGGGKRRGRKGKVKEGKVEDQVERKVALEEGSAEEGKV